jgi:predicted CopG family antitoxin
MRYTKEEKLNLERTVRITKEAYDLLRNQKRKQKISMAKIICNLIIEKYGNQS